MKLMDKLEVSFTQADIRKIKSKRMKSNIAFLFAFIIISCILYFKYDSLDMFFIIVLCICLAITSIVVFDMFFGDNSKKDLKNKIKIVTKVIVFAKHKKHQRDSATIYELEFEGNNDIKHYQVKEDVFEQIEVGNIIDLEYSKESLWILKIGLKSIDIENENYIK